MLSNLRNTLLALALGLLVGLFGGYYIKSKFVQADVVERVVEQRKDDAKAVTDMQKVESSLQKEVESSRSNVATIRKEIQYREIYVPVPKEPTDPAEEPNPSALGCGERVLSLAVSGMLNAARADQPYDPAAWGDGKGEAPSGVTDQELIDNDLEVVGMYHDLAKRHNALVDWVSQEVEKQNGKILAD